MNLRNSCSKKKLTNAVLVFNDSIMVDDNGAIDVKTFYSPTKVQKTDNLETLRHSRERKETAGSKKVKSYYHDDKLKCITKVHLERIPLQNMLNLQQKGYTRRIRKKSLKCNCCSSTNDHENVTVRNKKSRNKTVKTTTTLCSSPISIKTISNKDKNKVKKTQDITSSERRKVLNTRNAHITENKDVLSDKEKQKCAKYPGQKKQQTKSNKHVGKRENSSKNELLQNKSKLKVSKIPVYNQSTMEEENEDQIEDLYNFVVSPTDKKIKVKKRKNNNANKVHTSYSFNVFNPPKFTTKKPRKKRVRPKNKTFQAFLSIQDEQPLKTNNRIDNAPININKHVSKNAQNENITIRVNRKPPLPEGIVAANNLDFENTSDSFNGNSEYLNNEEFDYNRSDVFLGFDTCIQKKNVDFEKSVEEDIEAFFGFDDVAQQVDPDTSSYDIVSPVTKTPRNKVRIISNILIRASATPAKNNKSVSNTSMLETTTESLNDTVALLKKINSLQRTINDTVLHEDSPTMKPHANSTMIQPQTNVSDSWRLDDQLFQYNPHFLMLKQSSLPSVNQDTIIDYKFDESICQNSKQLCDEQKDTPPQQQQEKSTVVQKSILDYVESSGKVVDPELKERRVSFFDVDELSPLKQLSSNTLAGRSEIVKRNIFKVKSPKKRSPSDKENVDSNKKKKKNNTSRENMSLVVILDKIPVQQLKSPNLSNNFLFDSTFTIENENKCDKEQLPTRISPREIKKAFVDKSENKEKGLEVSPKRVVFESDSDSDDRKKDSPQVADEFPKDKINVGLFEEPELILKPASKKYELKRPTRRRQRVYSNESDTDQSEIVECPKKKKKNVMSKEEKSEFEKWAAAFNSECKEIEKFNLEID